MLAIFQTYTTFVALALLTTFIGTAGRVHSQTYQIDCAILLCLSGGWPASIPCDSARAEFMRRITPWPIEPPLQIWRCPMASSYPARSPARELGRVFDVFFNRPKGPTAMTASAEGTMQYEHASLQIRAPESLHRFGGDASHQLVQNRADIDISGPEFNFVRSIRVFDVIIDDHRDNGDCNRFARVRLGSYGTQGDFRWQGSKLSAVPRMFGPTIRGCSLRARAIFVEWRDFQGHYGFERVDY